MAIRVILAVSSLGIIFASCGEPLPGYKPPANTIKLSYGNPNSDPSRCGCAGSRPTYLVNSGSDGRQVSWQETRRDRISGQLYSPQPGSVFLPPTQSGSGQFIGCSIDAPSTSCRFDVNYAITSQASLLKVAKKMAPMLGTRVVASATACQAICSDPDSGTNGTCLPLGVRNYQAIAPLRTLIDEAVARNSDVGKSEILQKLNVAPSADKCERSGVQNKNGLLTNTGPSACAFRSRDLPQTVARIAGIERPLRAQMGMSIVLGKLAQYQVSTPSKTVGLIAQQTHDDTSPQVIFDGPGAEKLNRFYGGALQSLSRISLPGRPTQSVLQTENGCIAVDEATK